MNKNLIEHGIDICLLFITDRSTGNFLTTQNQATWGLPEITLGSNSYPIQASERYLRRNFGLRKSKYHLSEQCRAKDVTHSMTILYRVETNLDHLLGELEKRNQIYRIWSIYEANYPNSDIDECHHEFLVEPANILTDWSYGLHLAHDSDTPMERLKRKTKGYSPTPL
ncbi:hypothetical protein KC851_00390 [Candidatus Kaiserbacteria bacterium]|nr:hypothetical protein [Candidatus Kaiserbacteria bacterium]